MATENKSRFDCDVYEQSFSVSYDYPVYFTRSVFDKGSDLLSSVIDRKDGPLPHRIMVYIDSGVAETTPRIVERVTEYFEGSYDRLLLVCEPKVVPGGENAKNGWRDVRDIMTALGDQHMCRQSYVVAIGGGSVLDMVGFAASLVHRGVRQVRLPSTVLSQNDAGVGVKNAMNERETKNFVGCFAPPFAVINDFDFLRTLEQKDWVGGIAEAFKVAIIKDADFFDFLCENATRLRDRDEEAMETLIRRCAILHLEHIRTGGDPFEFGSSRPLDFGHWSGHKLEGMSGFALGHGQGVSIGIALDSFYAARKGLISEAERDRVLEGLVNSGLPVYTPLLARRAGGHRLEILAGMEDFREHLGGSLTVALPDGIGAKVEVNDMDTETITEGIEFLQERYGVE